MYAQAPSAPPALAPAANPNAVRAFLRDMFKTSQQASDYAAPTADTSLPPKPPPWDEIKASPEFNQLNPNEQLAAFEHWFNVMSLLASTFSDYDSNVQERFDRFMAPEKQRLSAASQAYSALLEHRGDGGANAKPLIVIAISLIWLACLVVCILKAKYGMAIVGFVAAVAQEIGLPPIGDYYVLNLIYPLCLLPVFGALRLAHPKSYYAYWFYRHNLPKYFRAVQRFGLEQEYAEVVAQQAQHPAKEQQPAHESPSFENAGDERANEPPKENASASKSLSDEFKFECPNCGQRIAAPIQQAGTRGICPTCQTEFTVPHPSATPRYSDVPTSQSGQAVTSDVAQRADLLITVARGLDERHPQVKPPTLLDQAQEAATPPSSKHFLGEPSVMPSSPPMTCQLYYMYRKGQQAGPYTLGQIKSMWRVGNLDPATLLFTAGMTEWKPLPDLAPHLDDSGPSSPETPIVQLPSTAKQRVRIGPIIFWVLATMALLVACLAIGVDKYKLIGTSIAFVIFNLVVGLVRRGYDSFSQKSSDRKANKTDLQPS